MSYHNGILRIQGEEGAAAKDPTGKKYVRPFWEVDYDTANEEGLSICGDPDFVIEQMLRQYKEVGIGTFMGLFQFGSMPHALVKKNIEMFSKHVLPELRKHANG